MPFWNGSLKQQAEEAQRTQAAIMNRATAERREQDMKANIQSSKQHAQQAGSEVKEAGKDAGQATKDAGARAQQATKDAGNRAQQATRDAGNRAKDAANKVADQVFQGQEIQSKGRKTDSGVPLPPELAIVGHGKKVHLGPGAAIGFGCGAGFGLGVTGGVALSPPNMGPGFKQTLNWVAGFGVGCGFGLGYGYGFGIGSKWESKLKKPTNTFASAGSLRK